MSDTSRRFAAIAADVIADSVLPLLLGFLHEDAARAATAADAGRQKLHAHLRAWIADIEGGLGEAALEESRFAAALESIWLLSIVTARLPQGQSDPDWVEVHLVPEAARATDLAAATAGALDVLRGSDVGGTFAASQHLILMQIVAAARMQNPAATRH